MCAVFCICTSRIALHYIKCNAILTVFCTAVLSVFGRMSQRLAACTYIHCTLYIHCIVPQSIDPNAASPPLCILNPQLADDEDQNTPKTHLLRLKSDIKMKYNGFEGISLILKC